jgi:hypothetical protein
MEIEVSNGELLDKVSILEIKAEKIKDEGKLKNVNKELAYLREKLEEWDKWPSNELLTLYDELLHVNLLLWGVEDDIRKLDRAVFPLDKHNPPEELWEYTFLAQSVYILNDTRASVKKEINNITASNLTEEKDY